MGKELSSLILGEKLGSGVSRDTYIYLPNPKYVIKVEVGEIYYGACFQNPMEWKTWQDVQYRTQFSKYFAPCLRISDRGKYLIQERTEPVPSHLFPKELPSFLSDLKPENFGFLLDGGKRRIVCHDYGYLDITFGFSRRMKKVDRHWLNKSYED